MIHNPAFNHICRHCQTDLSPPVLDLGYAPPSNSYVTDHKLSAPEISFPLRIRVCPSCFLVQTEDFADVDFLFDRDYAYFSSTSESWLAHAALYVSNISQRLGLSKDSFVIEVASNDGYLLKSFCEQGVPCLGIEPTQSTAEAAIEQGVPTLIEFFGEALGRKLSATGKSADLIVGNNVYAHVPDIDDFTLGLVNTLKPEGVVTLEFPHVLQLLKFNQFDTVYHEHFSYLSLFSVSKVFEKAGLRIFDVEQITTHGGSLRVYGCLTKASYESSSSVGQVLNDELEYGLDTMNAYASMQERAVNAKHKLLTFLLDVKAQGKTVAAYGAAAKGNTLLNFAGVRPDLLEYVVDAALSKQGKYMPASHIPIKSPDALRKSPPDYVLILPWNIAKEIKMQLSDLADAGTQFVAAIPELAHV